MNDVSLWLELTEKIMDSLSKECYDEVFKLLDKRQEIIDKQTNLSEFKKALEEHNILDMDKDIYKFLSKEMDEVKKEIEKHKKAKNVNIGYKKSAFENSNLFSSRI